MDGILITADYILLSITIILKNVDYESTAAAVVVARTIAPAECIGTIKP